MIAQFTDRRMGPMVIPNGIHVPEYAVTLMVAGKGPRRSSSPTRARSSASWCPRRRTCGDAISKNHLTTRGECDCMTRAVVHLARRVHEPGDELGHPPEHRGAGRDGQRGAFLKPSLDRLGIELDRATEHSTGIVFRNGAYVTAA